MAQEIERTEPLFGTPPDEKVNPLVRSKRDENERRFLKELKEELKKKKRREDELIISEEATDQENTEAQPDEPQEEPNEETIENETDDRTSEEPAPQAGDRIDLEA
ncbi:MAG TPA: hypothetical protein PLF13_00730 [candidate division Zixibacteria bacterium]|nr:hypothetical protein [candidate division Zixibacteria bacterium]